MEDKKRESSDQFDFIINNNITRLEHNKSLIMKRVFDDCFYNKVQGSIPCVICSNICRYEIGHPKFRGSSLGCKMLCKPCKKDCDVEVFKRSKRYLETSFSPISCMGLKILDIGRIDYYNFRK